VDIVGSVDEVASGSDELVVDAESVELDVESPALTMSRADSSPPGQAR